MIIDTVKLRESIILYMDKAGNRIEETVKNNRVAIRMFTALETRQIQAEKTINDIERLAANYLSLPGHSMHDELPRGPRD